MADPDVIAAKLDSLHRCLRRLRDKTPADLQTLVGDPDTQDIIALNLTRLVQVAVDVALHLVRDSEPPPATMAESFEALARQRLITPELSRRLRSAVGFRNIAVHSYQAIDWAIVDRILRSHLVDFEEFARAVVGAAGLR
jgi:uncharacterized protein YutE (UPF0331/DUF86 family)